MAMGGMLFAIHHSTQPREWNDEKMICEVCVNDNEQHNTKSSEKRYELFPDWAHTIEAVNLEYSVGDKTAKVAIE